MSVNLFPGYVKETEFVRLLRDKTGYGTTQTLRRWRRLGIGPKWIKVGRAVLYKIDQNPFEEMKTASSG